MRLSNRLTDRQRRAAMAACHYLEMQGDVAVPARQIRGLFNIEQGEWRTMSAWLVARGDIVRDPVAKAWRFNREVVTGAIDEEEEERAAMARNLMIGRAAAWAIGELLYGELGPAELVAIDKLYDEGHATGWVQRLVAVRRKMEELQTVTLEQFHEWENTGALGEEPGAHVWDDDFSDGLAEVVEDWCEAPTPRMLALRARRQRQQLRRTRGPVGRRRARGRGRLR